MKGRTRNLGAICGMLALSSLLWFNYSAVLPLVVDDWDLSSVQAGVVYSAFQAGYLLLVVPVGLLADRRSTRHVIAVGATVSAVATLAFALLARGFLTGTVLRFVAGLGMAAVYVPGMRFVSDWYPVDRGRAMGVYVGTFSVSSGFSFVLASSVAARFGWRAALAATGLLALGAGPLLLGVGSDPDVPDRSTASIDFSVLRNRAYLLTVGVYSAHNWELFGVRNWLPAFLVSTTAIAATGQPATIAGAVAGAVTAMSGVGNLAGGWISDRVGRPRVIAVGLGASALVSLTLGAFARLPFWPLVGLVLGYGVVISLDSAPTSTTITEVVAADRVGTALAVQSLVGTIPGVLAPVVFGAALDAGGYGLAFQTLGVAAALGVVATLALRNDATESRPGGA
ncbi:MFS transporter [Natribaculum luteum]|uniref:MFS transporter n=1 Tax=Natribaculum luteum TaxID=1586232 RepID=A0ABD5NXN1_9EURY|nr:MFS transporter [Natribaculum luteum]